MFRTRTMCFFWIGLLLLCPLPGFGYSSNTGEYGQAQPPGPGIQRLLVKPQQALNALVNQGIWPLLQPAILESYLSDLEGSVPDWAALHDQEGEEHGERLFSFNRARDAKREGHAFLTQPIAFLWSGILSHYDMKRGGFTLAIGPEYTPTSWGIVRFKPMGIPDDMIALPSPSLRTQYRKALDNKEKVEIAVLFIGHLVTDESIMYAFSHEEPGVGMIMPVVQVERVQYFLKTSP